MSVNNFNNYICNNGLCKKANMILAFSLGHWTALASIFQQVSRQVCPHFATARFNRGHWDWFNAVYVPLPYCHVVRVWLQTRFGLMSRFIASFETACDYILQFMLTHSALRVRNEAPRCLCLLRTRLNAYEKALLSTGWQNPEFRDGVHLKPSGQCLDSSEYVVSVGLPLHPFNIKPLCGYVHWYHLTITTFLRNGCPGMKQVDSDWRLLLFNLSAHWTQQRSVHCTNDNLAFYHGMILFALSLIW